jgi:ATP-dependent DNA ligase
MGSVHMPPLRPPLVPMLAKAADRLPAATALAGGAAYEPKWDGYRSVLFVDPDGVVVQSRRGKDITASFPDVADAAADQLPVGTVIDGELVVLGDGGTLDFAALQRRIVAPRRGRQIAVGQPASFVAFDLLAADGVDLRDRTFRERRHQLVDVMADSRPPLQLTPQTLDVEVARGWLRDYAQTPVGLEGVVVKGLGQPYRGGSRGWLKVRVRETVEVIVGAVTGTLRAPERLVLGMYDDTGELVVAGGTSSLSTRQRKNVVPWLRAPTTPHPWPAELPQGRMGHFGGGLVEVTLAEPLVVEVDADQSLQNGRWRHVTRFVRTRPDLSPAEASAPGR